MIMSVDIGTSYFAACVLGPDGLAHPVDVGTGASMFGGQFSLPSAVFVEENGDILVEQTVTTCYLALQNADLSAVLLVGGTSRVPLVQEMVRQFAGPVPVHCAPDLELAVAQGAINYR